MNMEEDPVVRKVPPAQGLVLVGAFDGIGGARRALEIVGIEPALYISIESDGECAQVVWKTWQNRMSFELVEGVSVEELQTVLATIPKLELGLVVAGPPCQGFSGLNRDRKGFKDSRSDGILQLVSLIQKLKEAGPNIEWNCLTENVASMTSTDMFDITEHLGRTAPAWPFHPFHLDAALFGHINRPRVYWVDFPVEPVGLKFERRIDYLKFTKTLPEVVKPPISELLDEGTVKCGAGLFPTAVRWLPRAEPPSDPAGYEDCDVETLEKWTASGYAMAPY